VSSDLPGIVDEISFDSGDAVRKGSVLLRLDTRQEQAQLAAGEARLDLARLSYERFKGLVETGAVSRAEYDAAAAGFRQAEANVREIRATIDRKTIRAPFSGVLGIRQVDVGQYLQSGSPIAPLQALDPVYVDFAVPQQELAQMRVRGSVRVQAEGLPDTELTGAITAINSVVDKATRNVQVRAIFGNPGAKLRPGMFVKAHVLLDTTGRVVSLPASAINYAPYGNSVYVVEELTRPDGQAYRGVRQQIVKLGTERGDLVAIASGIKPGEEVVTSGVFKLRNGVAVQVNNQTQPGSNPAPRPEDN
jgi:membrane fusion protein (multidrug efflux system)